jgi:nitronate monooxygenase
MRQKRDKRHLVTTGMHCSHGWIHDSDAWNRRKSLMRAHSIPCEYGDRLLCSRPLLEELSMTAAGKRIQAFCERFGLRVPILLAPMAGACPPSLSIAVANAGGLGACGALLMKPDEIVAWVAEVRKETNGPFQLNLWIPDPPPRRDAANEATVRAFLSHWGPPVAPEAGDATPPDFEAQCEMLLAARPTAVSSIMGLYPRDFVNRLKAQGIAWFANVTTVAEAKAAEEAGADVIVAQGMEAGGHRGSFDAQLAERQQIGLFSLLPAVVDAVRLPVVATGGIADARGVAAALALGASAVQIGTGFLRAPEAKLHPAWAKALAEALPERTMLTRAFSGRAGRSVATDYALAATAPDAPVPAPYPVQRGLTAAMRKAALARGDIGAMQAWAGQSAALARALPAAEIVKSLWDGVVLDHSAGKTETA